MNVRTETSTDPGLRRADVRRARELYRTVAERKRGKIIFLEVGVLLDPLGDGDQACSHALRRAWRAFEQPATDDARHRSLGQVAAKARERIKRLALLFADGDLDREGYAPGRLQAQADLEAAERALAGLADRRPGVALPPLEEALARLRGWRGALLGGDAATRRDVPGLLVEQPEVERLDYGKFALRMVWSPVGQALAVLRERGIEAA